MRAENRTRKQGMSSAVFEMETKARWAPKTEEEVGQMGLPIMGYIKCRMRNLRVFYPLNQKDVREIFTLK